MSNATRPDLRESEELLHERQQVTLAARHAPQSLVLRGVQRAVDLHLQQLGVARDGVQRSAKIVTHGREKIHLRPVGRFRLGARDARLLEEPRVVDSGRGAPREVLGEPEIILREAVPRFGRDERDGTQGAAKRDHGDDHGRAHLQLLDHAQLLFGPHGG